MITQEFRGLAAFSLLVAALATFAIAGGCDDDLFDTGPQNPTLRPSDACEPACTGDTVCVETGEVSSGEPVTGCFAPECPVEDPIDVCAPGASCVEGECRFESLCDPACDTGEHCVFESCITDYNAANICDPLAECRRACGPDSTCLGACERDQSTTCTDCLDDLQRCEARESCDANAQGCCTEDFCSCFPSASGCGAPPCDVCVDACGDDTACFNNCVEDEPACSVCLQDFFDCSEDADDPNTECRDEFCACATCD